MSKPREFWTDSEINWNKEFSKLKEQLNAKDALIDRLLAEIKMNTDKDFYAHCLDKVIKGRGDL